MLEKNPMVVVLAMLILLSFSAAQAAKPDGQFAGKAEHSESFWERWFGRAERVEEIKEPKKVEAKKETQKKQEREQKQGRYFTESERSSIIEYYRRGHTHHDKKDKKGPQGKAKKLPPGLQKKLDRGGQLPPGWQTKVARGEVLEAEVLRHSERIPDELARRLPHQYEGEVVRRVGDKVVRVLEGNGTVIDVIDLADIILR